MCCQKNKVTIPFADNSARKYPEFLRQLLIRKDIDSIHFQKLARMYNNAISFTSLGASIDPSVQGPYGLNVFKVSGALTHLISSVEPTTGGDPGFAQIYVVGDKGLREAEFRVDKARGINGDTGMASHMDPNIVLKLMQFLSANNPYAKTFRSAKEVLERSNAKTLKLQGVPTAGADPKRYNCPTVNEVAAIVHGAGEIIKPRQIVLHRKDNTLESISTDHSSYFPLRYPIFFPYGEQQWDNLFASSTSRVVNRKVGVLEWFSFMLFRRKKKFNPILAGRSLQQEIIVDMYISVEGGRLSFIVKNQKKLKVSQYNRLLKSLENQSTITGRCVILPATFIGSPRGMAQLYHDAMAITRKFGPPSLFITMTANPNWPEIRAEIPSNDSSVDHSTVVTRVFYLKMCYLLFILLKMDRLGRVIAFVFTVEFQKRGLPHLHLMLTLHEDDRPTTPELIDEIVSAEIPDQSASPELYAVVSEFMLHGPCKGRPCWNGKSCKLGYPKPFTDRTVNVDGAYPVYLRRDTGRLVKKHTSTFDNGSVVPYCPFLTRTFNCHINVEVPVNTSAIKYLYKYITKGHDRLTMSVDDGDEVKAYIEGRYTSAPEAYWRLFKFPLSGRSPSVTRLNIHDKDEQLVYFDGKDGLEGQINTGKASQTSLTMFYQLNIDDAVGADGRHARTLFYEEIPGYFSWNKSSREWIPRKTKVDVVGRIFLVSYLAGAKFYLRVLLLHRKGIISFEDLRTVEGVVCEDYCSACNELGLLVNDFLYDEALREASCVRTGYQLTRFFAMMCIHSPPSDPLILFKKHFINFTDDCSRVDMSKRFSRQLSVKERRVMAIFRLHELLVGMGGDLSAAGLKLKKREVRILGRMQVEASGGEDRRSIKVRLSTNTRLFNKNQQTFFDQVKSSIAEPGGKMFYLDGPGGTGKTFLLNALIDMCQLEGALSSIVASSGVAALLLKGGQTAHSAFKIPIDMVEGGECPIESGTLLGESLKATRVIIWDEAVTIHKYAIEAVNRTLMRLCESDMSFGGKVVIFSGDFRQILPVVKYNQYPPAWGATIKSSTIWQHVLKFQLTKNMRLSGALRGNHKAKNLKFSKSLLALGEGVNQSKDFSVVDLPDVNIKSMSTKDEMRQELITFVYNDLNKIHADGLNSSVEYLNQRCILAPLNRDVRKLNHDITARLPGVSKVLKSIDTPDPDSFGALPEECLNKISISGFPEHEIEIKVGMPLVVIRNIAINEGVCNGSRIVVKDFGSSFIIACLMSGPFAGKEITLPRVKLHNAGDARSGLSFFRYQFPVAPAYAMSVNKSQGQTLNRVGVYLETDAFSHGQLYVALSRVSDVNNLLVVKPANRNGVLNVVHKSIFDAEPQAMGDSSDAG